MGDLSKPPDERAFHTAMESCAQALSKASESALEQTLLLLPDCTAPVQASLRSTFDGLSKKLADSIEGLRQTHEESSTVIKRWHDLRSSTVKMGFELQMQQANSELEARLMDAMVQQELELNSEFEVEREAANESKQSLHLSIQQTEVRAMEAETERRYAMAKAAALETELEGMHLEAEVLRAREVELAEQVASGRAALEHDLNCLQALHNTTRDKLDEVKAKLKQVMRQDGMEVDGVGWGGMEN